MFCSEQGKRSELIGLPAACWKSREKSAACNDWILVDIEEAGIIEEEDSTR